MLQIRLFGPLAIERNGKSAALPPSNLARGLLAYLALYHGRKHTRSLLTGTFWPDEPEERARRALSQAIWHIRRLFPDLVEAEAETVGIPARANVWVDALAFEQSLRPWLNLSPLPEAGCAALAEAIDLYRGDLLEGIYEDWALLERERLRGQYQQALEELLLAEKSSGRFEQALEYGLHLLKSDSLRESVHREVMRLQHLLGRPEAALRQFETCRRLLREELDVEPETETLALAQETVRRHGLDPLPYLPERPPAASPCLDGAHPRHIPLVGRQAERAQILQHVEAALERRGGILLVEGEAGVGKTRLLQEVARDAEWRGAQVLWGRGLESGTLPYRPLLDALEAGLSPLRLRQIRQLIEPLWLKTLQPHLSSLASLDLGRQDSLHLPAALEERRFTEALAALLESWASVTPLALALDDLHWMDGDTLGILPNLALRLSQSGVLWIAAYRGEEVRSMPGAWERIQALDRAGLLGRMELSRLDQNRTGELIRSSLGLHQPAPLFESRLYQETDGNPLFVLETLRSLQDEGLLTKTENGGWSTPWDGTTADYTELPLPPLVERVITRRLAGLSANAGGVLSAAAVLGSQPDYDILQAICGLKVNAFLDAVRELTRRHFLNEGAAGYCFNHDKILHVAYQEIEPHERQRLHQAAGEALEACQPDQVSELARHFTCAGQWEKSAQYSLMAAEQAADIFANRQAVSDYTQAWEALDHCGEPPDTERRQAILTARAGIYDRLGQREAQRADLEALDGLPSEPRARLEQALRWAKFHEATSNYTGVIQAAKTAIEIAKSIGSLSGMAAAQVLVGRTLNMQADSQDAEAVLREALENARLSGDESLEAACAFALARVYYDYQNRYAEAVEHCQRALEIFETTGDQVSTADTLQLMGGLLTDLGDEKALECKQKNLDIRRRTGDRRGEANALYSLAIHYRNQGDILVSLEYSRQSVSIARSIGELRTEAYGRTYVGINLEESEPQQSLEEYQRALEIRRAIGQHAVAVDTLAGLARACLRLGRIKEAHSYIQEALAWVDEHGTFGVGDIGLVRLAAYDTFMAAGETERAAQVICTAHDDLMGRAATLADERTRKQFLENTPQHEKILGLYYKHQCRCIQVRLPSGRDSRQVVTVTWTIEAPEDEQVSNKAARRRLRLQRLLKEAREQGAEPAHHHLAETLGAGLRTIERDLAELEHG
jgi:DNA-binding SARP family transcriptional activator